MGYQRIYGNKTVTIPTDADGQADVGLDLTNIVIEAIIMPTAWTAGDITFLNSIALAGTYTDLHNEGGTEIALTNLPTAAAKTWAITGEISKALAKCMFLKFRSGVSVTPVQQGASREITIIYSYRRTDI